MRPLFQNRLEAGELLAERVARFVKEPNALVLALPRGGVPVAFPIAQMLRADLDIFVVRKLGSPGEEELAIGAVASGGVRVFNEWLIQDLRISPLLVEQIAERGQAELEARERAYRGNRKRVSVEGRTTVVVDDGLATGASMRAAVEALRKQGPARIVGAVPVAAPEAFEETRRHVNELLSLYTPEDFGGVGRWYQDFAQVSDGELHRYLKAALPSKS
jgi:putative phosphoribosyl transferase